MAKLVSILASRILQLGVAYNVIIASAIVLVQCINVCVFQTEHCLFRETEQEDFILKKLKCIYIPFP